MKSKLLFIKKWSCFYGPKLESSITSVALHEPKICQMVKVTKFCVESCSEEKSKLPPTSLAVEVKMRCAKGRPAIFEYSSGSYRSYFKEIG